MKKVLRILISILMAFSLLGCAPKETVTIDLSTMMFTAYFAGNTVRASDTLPLNTAFDQEIRGKLKIETWVLSERKDKSIPNTSFILIDNQNHQYHFSQLTGSLMLIAVTETGKNPLFYEGKGLVNALWTNYFIGLADILRKRVALLDDNFTFGTSAINNDPSIRRLLALSAGDNDSIQTLLDMSSWLAMKYVDAQREFDMTLTLSNMRDKLLFYKEGIKPYAIYRHFITAEHFNEIIFSFDSTVYDALKSKLETLQTSTNQGPSDLIKNDVFDQAFLWLSSVDYDPYPEWIFPLSETESGSVKSQLQINSWIRIETDRELSSSYVLLYDQDDRMIRIGYASSLYAIAEVISADNQILEQYLIPSNVIASTNSKLFTYWESGPSSVISTFEPTVLTRWVWGSFIEYETKDFNLTTAESQALMDVLKIETWTLSFNQGNFIEDSMCTIFCLTDAQSRQITIRETYDSDQPYVFATIDLGGPTQTVFYDAPDSVINDLVAYLKAHYPVK